MWLFKQNIFKLRRIIEEVITYFDVFTAVTSDVCSSPTQNLDLLFCLLVLPSVILVTDNVTKAAQVYSDGTNKAY
jgi:hypothetical protein